jgi:hypothetical protein
LSIFLVIFHKFESGNLRKLQQERINKVNPRRKLIAEEAKLLNKLEAIANKLKFEENVQNR